MCIISGAELISDSGVSVSWLTPLGLPVIQPYRKLTKYDTVDTVLQKIQITRQSQFVI